MSGGKSDYLELKVLDHVLGKTTFTAGATTYIALYLASPSDAGGGTEVAAGGGGTPYARVAYTNNTTNWPNAASGKKSNGTTITFPVPSSTWGNVVAFGVLDSATIGAGNLYYWGPLQSPQQVNSGDQAPTFAAGALVIQED